jgi:hypothetical protein
MRTIILSLVRNEAFYGVYGASTGSGHDGELNSRRLSGIRTTRKRDHARFDYTFHLGIEN